ncbi:hypothetical protein IFM89_001188 [Coptis chinensis]|uniref:Uncharacterized protein n=1 Tax=Coptis chinensis TaxID=261450 RepID=A0A835IIE4_9MAGN|nr:hypothetical protein IFM89_001188 [Coptis chinensis]
MASGLERGPIVILRMEGEDLLEFINSPRYEPEVSALFSQIHLASGPVVDYIAKVLQQLTVDHGMPPMSDSWVVRNIVEPAMQSGANIDGECPVTLEMFLEEFKKVAERLVQRLKEHPVIVAHSEQIFDGSGIRRLLSNKFELNKTLEGAVKNLARDQDGKVPKEYIYVALDSVGSSAGLAPFGTIDQMDNIVKEAIHVQMIEADDEEKMNEEEELKKLMAERRYGRLFLVQWKSFNLFRENSSEFSSESINHLCFMNFSEGRSTSDTLSVLRLNVIAVVFLQGSLKLLVD